MKSTTRTKRPHGNKFEEMLREADLPGEAVRLFRDAFDKSKPTFGLEHAAQMIRLTALLNNYQVTRDNDWLRANIGWVTDGPTTPSQAEIERIALTALAAQIEQVEQGNMPLRAIGFNGDNFMMSSSRCAECRLPSGDEAMLWTDRRTGGSYVYCYRCYRAQTQGHG